MADRDAKDVKKARKESLYEKMTADGSVLLLDGEVGGLLWKRGSEEFKTKLVPATILLNEPHKVRELHTDYINAGANVITTNTYATVQKRFVEVLGRGDAAAEEWRRAITTACKVAVEAREASRKDVLIAGTLPPLHGSYKPAQVGEMKDIVPVYAEHVAVMRDYVDVFLCETMSTAQEGWAAASEAKKSGKPVWVSWTLKDDASGHLRSGETLEEAYAAIADLNVDGVMVNCCSVESIGAAVPRLMKMGPKICGGHGNGFLAIPDDWRVEKGGIAALGKREGLTPEKYANYARAWVKDGARMVGGCCQVGPEFIESLRAMLSAQSQTN
eukprot:TRINITY_DN25360_c0_g2_i1.p1 TRINITY_DN25360_c0_g2~~TRINITY_DN25360_c0_g2_i1.p1  ORF type:complete len:349 (-),score=74.86 TRINITY_DN25360_c0_g2_i1:196-1182(-)